jgi:hypothetical protein
MGAASRGGDDLVKLPSPAQFPAAAHRDPQWPLAGEPVSERTRHPSADVVQVVGGFDEVKNRVLQECVRKSPARKTRVVDASRMVNHQAMNSSDPPVRRDSHMNQRGSTVR